MAPGFAFPPPPPPPPKQSEHNTRAAGFRDGSRGSHTPSRGGRGGQGRGSMLPQHSPVNVSLQSPYQSSITYPTQSEHYSQKRKRDADGPSTWRGGHTSRPQPHPMKPKASIPKPAVAPAVPSFGAPLTFALPQASQTSGGTSAKVKLFGQGLSHVDALDALINQDASESEDDDDEDEDEDEERTLSLALGSTERLRFEHNGEFVVLDTAQDLQAWQSERRRNWPNNQHIAEKYKERLGRIQERRRIEAETQALVYGTSVVEQQPEDIPIHPVVGMTRAEELRAQLLRQKQMRSGTSDDRPAAVTESPIKDSTTGDEVSLLHSWTLEPHAGPVIPGIDDYGDSTSTSSDPEGGLSDSDGSEGTASSVEEGESSGPEVQTTKLTKDARKVISSDRICDAYGKTGRCKFGHNCRHQHIRPQLDPVTLQPRIPRPKVQTKKMGTRKTLHQRLVEQEQEAENKLALQAIKYLGSIGFFRPSAKD